MNKKLRFLLNIAYWGALIALAVLTFRYIVPAILPFLLGYAIAALWNPLITKLSKYRQRGFSAAIIIFPFWGVVLFLLWKVGVLLYGETLDLLRWIQNTDFSNLLASMEIPFISADAGEWLAERADDLLPTIIEVSQSALMKLLNLLLGLPNAILFSFAMVVSSFLLAVSYPKIEPFILRQLSARLQTEYFDIKEFLFRKMLRIVRAYGTMLGINYIQLLLGFWILHVPYPLILAAVIALFDLLPYVGIVSVLVPWGLIEWIIFSKPTLGIGLIILSVVVSVVREILEPKIVGKTIGLSALATLFSIYLGLKLMGFFGMILFPLLFLFLKEWNDSGRIVLWRSASDDS